MSLSTTQRTTVSFTASALSKWIEQLPKANVVRCTELVTERLHLLANSNIDPTQRYACLEALHPFANYLAHMLHQLYLQKSLVEPFSKRPMMQLCQNLLTQIADCYRRIGYTQNTSLSEIQVVTSLQRALNAIHLCLLRSIQLYQVTDVELIGHAYKIYRFACTYEISQVKIVDHKTGYHDTIDQAFKRLVLLLSCSPYQLTPPDLETLELHLHEMAKLSVIHARVQSRDMFVINLADQLAPQYQQIAEFEISNPDMIGIDNAVLREKLIDPLHFSSSNALPGLLREHLINSWCSFRVRRSERNESSGKIAGVIGISTICYFLNQEKTTIDLPTLTSRPTETASELRLVDVTDTGIEGIDLTQTEKLQDPWNPNHSQQRRIPANFSFETENSPAPEPHEWDVVNTSEHGFCLSTSAEYPEDLKVGKVIGIQALSHKKNSQWQIALIRWVKYGSDDRVNMGVEVISTQASCIGIQNESQQEHHYRMLQALLLPAISDMQLASTIITSAVPFHINEVVRIANRFIDADVYLENKIDSSRYFNRFTYRTVGIFSEDAKKAAVSKKLEATE